MQHADSVHAMDILMTKKGEKYESNYLAECEYIRPTWIFFQIIHQKLNGTLPTDPVQ